MTHTRTVRAAAFVCLALLGAMSACAQDAGLAAFVPETLYDKTQVYLSANILCNEQTIRGTSRVPDPMDSFRNDYRQVLGGIWAVPEIGEAGTFSHSLTRDWTLFGALPFLYREFRVADSGVVHRGRFSEVGDIGVYARREYFWWMAEGKKTSVFLMNAVGGIEFPTGSTSRREGGSRLSADMQPGRGSYSLLVGHLVNYEARKFEVFGTTAYAFRSLFNPEYEHGDMFSQDARIAYRIVHEDYPGQTVSLKGGLRYEAVRASRLWDHKVANSGYRELDAVGGLFWQVFADSKSLGGGLDITFEIEYPIWQDVTGTQLAKSFAFQFQIAFRFTSLL